MSISPDTNATFPHVLACDAKEPRSRQRRFFLKNLSRRDYDQYAFLARQGEADALTPPEVRQRLFAALGLILAGWRAVEGMDGQPMPFSPGAISGVLTLAESWELYFAGIARLEVEGEERKNSESPSGSAKAASAGDAEGPGSAKTGPVNGSP